MTVINVIYSSRSGNTKKIADAIAYECEVDAIDVHEPNNITGTDLLFVGMGIYAGKPDGDMLDYLDQLPVNAIKGAAVFSTSATGNDHLGLAINLLEHKGVQVYPRHLLLKGKFLLMNKGKPGEEELEEARDFAYEVMDAFNY
ncbi:MAG: hypothetical protein IKS32_04425 [Solobacterium sp.]|nr:hypothetical protein [Solobacterium sp.]